MSRSFERWIGNVAVVTGASSGIGAAVIDLLVDRGLIVVGIARRVELIEEKARNLADKPGKLFAVKADISSESKVVKAFRWIEQQFGDIHILINSAGIINNDCLWNGSTEKWRNALNVNILGLCIATREAVKIMKKHHIHGHIIHVNGTLGHHCVPSVSKLGVCTGTKQAVTGLTTTLKKELIEIGSKIKITNVSPGMANSEERQPSLKAEDVAEAIMYILSTPEHVLVTELIMTPMGKEM